MVPCGKLKNGVTTIITLQNSCHKNKYRYVSTVNHSKFYIKFWDNILGSKTYTIASTDIAPCGKLNKCSW